MNQANGTAGKTDNVITVSRKELPLSCPRSAAEVALSHPRVFLAIEKTGEAICPYCGAHYRLAD